MSVSDRCDRVERAVHSNVPRSVATQSEAHDAVSLDVKAKQD